MELRLDPEIPVTRVVNGHNVFNKGYHHGLRCHSSPVYKTKNQAPKWLAMVFGER